MELAILLGIISTVQLHLAKAFERQGIEIYARVAAALRGQGLGKGGARRPAIYLAGLLLNNTVFIYALVAQQHAPPAVYTSMFGVGLVALMLYSGKVLHETISKETAAGAAAIVAGSLVIGLENIGRGEYNRAAMAVEPTLLVVAAFFAAGLVLAFLAARRRDARLAAFAFGFFAGGCGSLDPFLKGLGQNLSGRPEFVPTSTLGLAVFVPSFLVGFLAFAITQVGFAKRAPASLLVPVYNATYILLPVLLQMVLLPSYRPYPSTFIAVALIVLGVFLMRGLRR